MFGLPVMFEDENSAVFEFGNVIPVDDVDAMCAELAVRGVTLLNGHIDRP